MRISETRTDLLAQPLTFLWQRPERWFQSRLLRFILVSLLGHLLAFLLFQIVTDEKVTAPDRERELQLLSNDLPEHQALLQLVEAEVPIAALSHQLLAPETLLERSYRSAFTESRVTPREPARWKPEPIKLRPIFPPHHGASTQPAPAAVFSGSLRLDPPLKERLEALPEIPGGPVGKLLESPSFLIGIAGSGEVQFVFLDKSSGDAEADALAEATLRQTTFKGGATSVLWGNATLLWKTAP